MNRLKLTAVFILVLATGASAAAVDLYEPTPAKLEFIKLVKSAVEAEHVGEGESVTIEMKCYKGKLTIRAAHFKPTAGQLTGFLKKNGC